MLKVDNAFRASGYIPERGAGNKKQFNLNNANAHSLINLKKYRVFDKPSFI